MEQRQNLVFIMTDHQRADSIGMVQTDKDGQSTEVCPTLNRLAAEGAYFSRMYNASPLCVPARTALATGKYPTHNGIVYNDWQGTCAGQRQRKDGQQRPWASAHLAGAETGEGERKKERTKINPVSVPKKPKV